MASARARGSRSAAVKSVCKPKSAAHRNALKSAQTTVVPARTRDRSLAPNNCARSRISDEALKIMQSIPPPARSALIWVRLESFVATVRYAATESTRAPASSRICGNPPRALTEVGINIKTQPTYPHLSAVLFDRHAPRRRDLLKPARGT